VLKPYVFTVKDREIIEEFLKPYRPFMRKFQPWHGVEPGEKKTKPLVIKVKLVKLPKASKEAIALAVLTDNPDWSDAQIADAAGCSRGSLFRFKKFGQAKAILRAGKDDMARGSKFSDKAMESWNEEDLGDKIGQYRRPKHKPM